MHRSLKSEIKSCKLTNDISTQNSKYLIKIGKTMIFWKIIYPDTHIITQYLSFYLRLMWYAITHIQRLLDCTVFFTGFLLNFTTYDFTDFTEFLVVVVVGGGSLVFHT